MLRSPQPQAVQRGKEHVTVTRLRVLYDCEALCGRTPTDPGRMSDRAAMRCSLPGFDPQRWDPGASPGAADDADRLASTLAHQAEARGIVLDFELERDGCPRGWMLSRFVGSVLAFTSPRGSDSPVRSQNIRLMGRVMRDPEEPTRLLDWAAYAEALEDGAWSYYHEVASSS